MIQVEGLTKTFSKPVRQSGFVGMLKTMFTNKKIITKAVDHISFNISDGEIVGYIGANGAGKSTTIKMMCGILTPTSGKVLIDGLEPYNSKTRDEILKEIGVVFGQRTQLWWDLPVIETFNLYKEIYEVSDSDYQERLAYFTKVLDLNKFLNSPVRTLSLGQRMRADLAASLIHNPKVLFLDEPTIGLDVLVKDKITKAIKEINHKYNTTIILTTHDMGDINNLCSRVIIIDEGRLLYDGELSKIKTKFGDIRHIHVLLNQELDTSKMQKAFPGLDLRFKKDEAKYDEISYDALKIELSSLLDYLSKNYQIKDMQIVETSLATIVKRIYEKKEA
jgi:ABC-2 type transport system ATP-binding protein